MDENRGGLASLMKGYEWTDRSSILALIMLFIVVFTIFFSPVLHQDGILYVSPARSLVIDGDLNIFNENYYFIRPGWNNVLNRQITGKSRVMIKYVNAPEYTSRGYKHVVFPIGNALSWLPPIFITHQIMDITQGFGQRFVNDGFSEPYIFALGFYSFFLGLLGAIIAYQFLRFWYSPGISYISLAFGVLATNLIPFITRDVTFSHCLDFILVNTFLLMSLKMSKALNTLELRKDCWDIILWGLVGGWMIIVRYQDVFLLLFPLVFFTKALWLTKGKRDSIAKNAGLFFFMLLLSLSLQVMYWKILYGQWFVTGSLMGTGNLPSFHPFNPELLQMLFSFFHGLYSWMPLLLPVTFGAVLMVRRNRLFGVLFLIVMLTQFYYNGSRSEWWNMGFSVRRFSGWSLFFMIGFAELYLILRPYVLKALFLLVTVAMISWHWIFMINYYLQGHPASIYNTLTDHAKPFGNARLGIILPRPDLLIQGLKTVKIWWLDHSWLSIASGVIRSGGNLLTSLNFLVYPITLVLGSLTIYFVWHSKRVPSRGLSISMIAYIVITGTWMFVSDAGTDKIVHYEVVDSKLQKSEQKIRINSEQLFVGENRFSRIDGVVLEKEHFAKTRFQDCIWLFGAPRGEFPLVEIVERENPNVIKAFQTLSFQSKNCKYLEKIWGDVNYSHDWYKVNFSLDPAMMENGDLMISIPGGSDVIFATMYYAEVD